MKKKKVIKRMLSVTLAGIFMGTLTAFVDVDMSNLEQVRRSKLIYVTDEPDHIVEYGHDPISGLPDFVDNADISDFI